MTRTSRTTQLTFAEFFAGIGLVRMGLERASSRWQCAFANDFDPMKRSIYTGQFDDEPDSTDVHLLSGDTVPSVDLATASFPCTDLSLAGRRKGIRCGESSAFWGFHRVLQEMGDRRPRAVLLENVVGLLHSHAGRDFRDVLCAMNELGYLVDPLVLNARWFVPQSRARLFVVCVKRDLADGPSEPLIAESRLRPPKLIDFMTAFADDIKWSCADLPEPPVDSGLTVADIVQDPPVNHPDWWSEERVDYLYNQMFERHQAWVDEHTPKRRSHYATVFRRVRPLGDGTKRSMAELRTDGIAGCLRTPKGGSGRQILVRAGRGRLRARLLSGPECAALMGADGYRLSCTTNQALFGFGDAVCVDAIAWLAKHALMPILAKNHAASYAVSRDGLAAVPTPAAPRADECHRGVRAL